MAICTGTSAASGASTDAWQTVLAEAIHTPAELCRRLGLPATLATEADRAAGDFPLLAPEPFVARIQPGDSSDPLLLQILPRANETIATPGYCNDPLGEADVLSGSSLLRKYRGRTLIVTGGTCGVHCRFCFRRHFRLQQRPLSEAQWANSLQTIASDPSIHEVILSGGDPLTLSDSRLSQMADDLAAIPHVDRLRIHTRMPIVIPQRVTDELIALLRGTRLSAIMVVHVNHSQEIDGMVASAFARLIDAGVPVLSQSVLLRGVNDRVEVLASMYKRLVDLRVMPYYLHQLDAVAGAAHFSVPVAHGIELMALLRAALSGYAVPRYVREKPGGRHKEVLA